MTIQYKKLNDLKIARENTRKSRSKDQIDTIAASIQTVGLLHTLVGYEDGETTFITDGGSRLNALREIEKNGEGCKELLANIPVTLCSKEQALDISLSANLVRNAMTQADQFIAFHRLHHKRGIPVVEIAKRYYVDSETVRRILKLASLAKPIFHAFKAGEISLDVAKAYAGCSQVDRQLSVFEICGLSASAHTVRRHLRENSYYADSARVAFVTLEAYQAQGGVIEEDLFDEKTVLLDGHIVDELMVEAVAAHTQRLREGGWSEVVYFDDSSALFEASAQNGGRIYPEFKPTKKQQARLETLGAKLEAMGDYWSLDADEQKRHKRLSADYEAIEENASSFSEEQKQDGVCFWYLGQSGTNYQCYALAKQAKDSEKTPKEQRDYSESFERNVLATAGDALMKHLVEHPHAVCTAMTIAALESSRLPAVNFDTKRHGKRKFDRGVESDESQATTLDHWSTTPAQMVERVRELVAMSETERQSALAKVLRISFTLGEKSSDYVDQKALFDLVAEESAFELFDYWTFGEEELKCLTKLQLIRILGTMGLTESSFGKAKKSELVTVVARYTSERNWLPEFIRRDATDGAQEGEATPMSKAA